MTIKNVRHGSRHYRAVYENIRHSDINTRAQLTSVYNISRFFQCACLNYSLITDKTYHSIVALHHYDMNDLQRLQAVLDQQKPK